MELKGLIAVFIGSGVGGLTRFLLGKWIDSMHDHYFPFGTLIVNLVACFALGLIIGLADYKDFFSPTAKLFLTVGFCGGFSTFSTFSRETLTLFEQGHSTSSIIYVFASVFFCITATFAGLFIAGRL